MGKGTRLRSNGKYMSCSYFTCFSESDVFLTQTVNGENAGIKDL